MFMLYCIKSELINRVHGAGKHLNTFEALFSLFAVKLKKWTILHTDKFLDELFRALPVGLSELSHVFDACR